MGNTKLLYPFKNSSYQTFLEGFADELKAMGIPVVSPLSINLKIRQTIAKLKLSRNFKSISKNRHLIVLCAGYPDYAAFPFAYSHNIIPVIWDSWPRYWDRIVSSFKRHNIKLAFFTQKQVAEYIHCQLPDVDCVHIAEGLNQKGYREGDVLSNRRIDVLELGRLCSPVHEELLKLGAEIKFNHLYAEDVTQKRLFDTFDDLAIGLANSKIVINFPRSITHPEMAGQVETLTQRYWECMYSRAIMIGHCPNELVEIIGYNPVIECTQDDVREKVKVVLSNINDYQQIVDMNYVSAINHGSWKTRLDVILEKVQELR